MFNLTNKQRTNLNKILFLIIKLIIAKYNSPSSGITLSHSSLWFSFLVLTMEITLITHSGYTRIDFIKPSDLLGIWSVFNKCQLSLPFLA